MESKISIRAALEKLKFDNREADFNHYSYTDDMAQYEYVKQGDERAVEECCRMFQGPNTGMLSLDPVRNFQYMFVAAITLVCRFCIAGGMREEESYSLSDVYILRVDRCTTVQEIFDLHEDMIRDFTERMRMLSRRHIYSRQVILCMDHIEKQLQQPLTVEKLAEELDISPSYLSVIFKKETGIALSEYIRRERIKTARILLQYTEYSCQEIAEYLCFSSDSHFSSVFHKYNKMTPREYRKKNYRKQWEKYSLQDRNL